MAVPPVFVSGQVLTAAQMNAVGLWLVKTQTIGTAVSSVEVTGAFSADYDNYHIIVTGGAGSTNLNLALTLGSTTTGYYAYGYFGSYSSATLSGSNVNNDVAWTSAGNASTNGIYSNVFVGQPFAAKRTMFSSRAASSSTSAGVVQYDGFLNNDTSYTSFKFTTSTGTLTGGTIHVYGYRD